MKRKSKEAKPESVELWDFVDFDTLDKALTDADVRVDVLYREIRRNQSFAGGLAPEYYNVAFTPPADMDAECVDLCVALNELPGIRTFESCCGHGVDTLDIYFYARGLRHLQRVAYVISVCHKLGVKGWSVTAHSPAFNQGRRLFFVLRGPIGDYSAIPKIIEELKLTRDRRRLRA